MLSHEILDFGTSVRLWMQYYYNVITSVNVLRGKVLMNIHIKKVENWSGHV